MDQQIKDIISDILTFAEPDMLPHLVIRPFGAPPICHLFILGQGLEEILMSSHPCLMTTSDQCQRNTDLLLQGSEHGRLIYIHTGRVRYLRKNKAKNCKLDYCFTRMESGKLRTKIPFQIHDLAFMFVHLIEDDNLKKGLLTPPRGHKRLSRNGK